MKANSPPQVIGVGRNTVFISVGGIYQQTQHICKRVLGFSLKKAFCIMLINKNEGYIK